MAEATQAKGKSMKHLVRIVLFLVIGVVSTGCNKSTEKDSKAQSDDSAAAQRERAMTATKEAAQSVQDYAYAQKGEFVAAAKRQLADIQAETARLGTAIDQSTGPARAAAEAKLEVVNEKLAAATAQLDRAQAAPEAAWQDVQNGYRTAHTDLRDSFDETREWLSKQIEP